MILDLVKFPDPLLKKVSKEIDNIDDNLRKFMDNMLDTMYSEGGIGLAAVQVGALKRILVVHIQDDNRYEKNQKTNHKQELFFIINPKFTYQSKETSTFCEGCLSFPEITADVIRPKEIEIEYLDYYGKKQKLKADGLLATCIQHEIDHLNGITFVDHLTKLKKDMLLKKLTKKQKIMV